MTSKERFLAALRRQPVNRHAEPSALGGPA